ncbi:MAG: stage II sporulation protein P [Ruminococcaceae bacterium]|nr:stage II sporulation protein P [Oscillospiraceae bacterium]
MRGYCRIRPGRGRAGGALLMLLCAGLLYCAWRCQGPPQTEPALPVSAESAPPPASSQTVEPEPEPEAVHPVVELPEQPSYLPEIRNETSFLIDPAALPAGGVRLSPAPDDAPQVLIVHTHSSESYTPDETHYYIPDDNDRTLDTRYNVSAVGDRIEEVLERAGIAVIHDRTINDYPSYSGSYARMLETIELYLAEYPSIQVVLDVHRDAILEEDGSRRAVRTVVGDRSAAQLMLVVGTDEGGLAHEDWEQNLAFAMAIQKTADWYYPGLMRPINLRSSRFNQHVSPGALIVEVGSSGNTLGEALYSGALFANILADTLRAG